MSNRISIKQIRAFCKLAEAGTFTGASSELHLSQSSLTTIIQQLEDALNAQLFLRTTRRVTLTKEGQYFQDKASEVLRVFDSAIEDFRDFAAQNFQQVPIAACSSIVHHILPDAMAAFRNEHPRVSIILRDSDAENAAKLVTSGAVEFAIAGTQRFNPDLSYAPLIADIYGVIRSGGHAGGAAETAWHDLESGGFINFTADTNVGYSLRHMLGNTPLLKGRADEVSSTNSLRAALNDDRRYAIVSKLSATMPMFADMTFQPLTDPRVFRQLYLITLKARPIPPHAKSLLDTILGIMARKRFPDGVVKGLAPA